MKDFETDREAKEAKEQARAERGTNPKIAIVATLVIGFGLGLITGRVTAPGSGDTANRVARSTPAAAKEAEAEKESPSLGTLAGLAKQAGDFIDNSGEASGLSAVTDILSHASMSDILDWQRDPKEVTGRIINEMSDEELTNTITSLINIPAENLGEYSDLREYANRLSGIALSGLITEDLSEEFADIDLSVEFGTDASSSRGAEDPTSVFPEKTRKIYAVIQNPGDMAGDVMVHWYRTDQPKKLLLDRYRISPEDNYSYVWLKHPNRRWAEGDYRVEFYSADEFLAPLASGTYRVVAE